MHQLKYVACFQVGLQLFLLFSINQVIVKRGRHRVEKKMEHSKQPISVMFCGNGDGTYLPPLVLYRAQNVYGNWIEGGPRGTIHDCTTSGWFDSVTFDKWFFKFFFTKCLCFKRTSCFNWRQIGFALFESSG